MRTWTLLTVSFLYCLTGYQSYFVDHKSPWWIVFWCSYAVANIAWLAATGGGA